MGLVLVLAALVSGCWNRFWTGSSIQSVAELLLWRCHGYQGCGEAEGHHEDVMQNHQDLPAEVTRQRGPHGETAAPRLLVTFDLQLVPVTHKHSVDVVQEVWRCKQDVVVGQPVSEEQTEGLDSCSSVFCLHA